ncbi:MAG: hypothetical protein ACRDXE_04690 [Acidimicrobiales bacterium]
MRVAVLEADGVPLPGALNLYATDGIAKFEATPVYTKGADMEIVNGCGAPAIIYKDMDRFKRYDTTLELVYIDAELENMLIGGELFTTAGMNIGTSGPAVAAYAGNFYGVSMEFWSKHVVNGDQDGTYPWVQWVMPRSKWMKEKTTLDNNPMPMNYTGFSSANPQYFNGPANDWTFASDTQLMWRFTKTIPASVCGAQPLVHT